MMLGSLKKSKSLRVYPGYLRNNQKKTGQKGPALWLILSIGVALAVSIFVTIRLMHVLSHPAFPYYRVHMHDTLPSLAQKFNVDPNRILALNNFSSASQLVAGKLILMPQNVSLGATHKVTSRKETLSYISNLYNISQWDLVRYNDLDRPIVKKGHVLNLTQTRPEEYIVQMEDTITSLSQRFGIPENKLLQYNALNSDSLIIGQKLLLYPQLDIDFQHLPVEMAQKSPKTPKRLLPEHLEEQHDNPEILPTDKTLLAQAAVPPVVKPLIPPVTLSSEEKEVVRDFQQAKKVWTAFEQEVALLDSLGTELQGYAIMLDPGHGGYDPGAIVPISEGNPGSYLVEHEFNYDIALRLYRLLKRHGAEVSITILSPKHTIRESNQTDQFVNEKNAVYNDASLTIRPTGGRDANEERVKIGQKYFRYVPQEKRIWISLHHDSSPDSPSGLVAIHLEAEPQSYKLAQRILQIQQRGRIIKDKFFVLANNPAPAAVLVEVRNPAIGEGPFMLSSITREYDAQAICQAVLSYVQAQKDDPFS